MYACVIGRTWAWEEVIKGWPHPGRRTQKKTEDPWVVGELTCLLEALTPVCPGPAWCVCITARTSKEPTQIGEPDAWHHEQAADTAACQL